MDFTPDMKFKKVINHSTDAATYLLQLENNNFVTYNEKKGLPTVTSMHEFPTLIQEPIWEQGD